MILIKDEKVGQTIDDLCDALYASNLQIFPCYQSGGALRAFDDENFDRTLRPDHLRCIYDGNIVVLYDGTIYPCCSQVVVKTGLSIGNFMDISLKEALKKIRNNVLLHFLRTKELGRIVIPEIVFIIFMIQGDLLQRLLIMTAK